MSETSNEEKYRELSEKYHDELAKKNNVCDFKKLAEHEKELVQLEAEMKIGKP